MICGGLELFNLLFVFSDASSSEFNKRGVLLLGFPALHYSKSYKIRNEMW